MLVISKKKGIIYDEPFEVVKERTGEVVNRARWSGDWSGIAINAERLVEKYSDVPASMQSQYKRFLDALSQFDAKNYQKHDAVVAALKKQSLLTHTMGLGKTRIALLISILLKKRALITALPRLVRKVWAGEMKKLGMSDYIILERPKKSDHVFIRKCKEGLKDLVGSFKGLGKITLGRVSREPDVSVDHRHPAQIKIVSYNMLLPGYERLHGVVCPDCGLYHKEDRCPSVKILWLVDPGDRKADAFITRLQVEMSKGKMSQAAALEEIKKQLGSEVKVVFQECRTPAKGSLCPKCNTSLGNKQNRGYHCSRCGYSARTYLPSLARRLKKNVDVMFIDESQAVKNSQSLRTKCTLSINPKHRYLISGTPATKDVGDDLYGQLLWLIGKGVMFPYSSRQKFKDSLWRDTDMRVIHELLDPYQVRRNADDYGVTSEVILPPYFEKRMTVKMTEEEADNYKEAHENVVEWLKDVTPETGELDVFSKMWILRRSAVVPWADNPNIKTSSKLKLMGEVVNEALQRGRKVLIGTEMLDALDGIMQALPDAARIDGSVPIKKSDRIMSLFQDVCPDCGLALVEDNDHLVCPMCEKKYKTPQVLAVSREAVKEGVTLNKASLVILTDPSWIYTSMWQFACRAWRIGASYEKLEILYLESEGTIDQDMYEVAFSRKEAILKAINRKAAPPVEKVDIRAFVAKAFNINLPIAKRKGIII